MLQQCLGSGEISAPGRSLNDEMKGRRNAPPTSAPPHDTGHAMTAGRYAVCYSGEQCLGSGEISAPGRSLNDEMKGEEERTADQRAS